MKLSDIILQSEVLLSHGDTESFEVCGIAENADAVQAGDVLFIRTASPEIYEKARERGASAIVSGYGEYSEPDIPTVWVSNVRAALALAHLRMHGNPQKDMRFIGITGTNGKSTTCLMAAHILRKAGHRVGIIGTLFCDCGNGQVSSDYTTPPPVLLASELAEMHKNGIDTVVMEVSSHSLSQERVYGIDFDIGIFTNLTHDHLDFHGSLGEYASAKEKLFRRSKVSLINIDDKAAYRMAWASGGDVFYYGRDRRAEFYFENEKISAGGSDFDFCISPGGISHNIKESILPLGDFNVYNATAALACAYLFGVSEEKLADALSDFPPVRGRMERIYAGDFDVIVDYAHTPDALGKAVSALREVYSGRIITLFGCGGDRDKTKRPEMGDIAASLSDLAIVTSDNPRTEDPAEIIRDICMGIRSENYITEINREKAIKIALSAAKKGDVILLAGKGHEDYVIDKEGKHDFCERETVLKIIKEKD